MDRPRRGHVHPVREDDKGDNGGEHGHDPPKLFNGKHDQAGRKSSDRKNVVLYRAQ